MINEVHIFTPTFRLAIKITFMYVFSRLFIYFEKDFGLFRNMGQNLEVKVNFKSVQ